MITRTAFACHSGRKSDGIYFEPQPLGQLARTRTNIPLTSTNGAVGAPDTLVPVLEGPEAHCDNADILNAPGYP